MYALMVTCVATVVNIAHAYLLCAFVMHNKQGLRLLETKISNLFLSAIKESLSLGSTGSLPGEKDLHTGKQQKTPSAEKKMLSR